MIILFTTTNDEQSGQPSVQEIPTLKVTSARDSWLTHTFACMVCLGDFEVNDYRGNNATTAVFLAFTVLGVIILLNVLIAIVSDSYESSKVGAKALFGKARIGFWRSILPLSDSCSLGKIHWHLCMWMVAFWIRTDVRPLLAGCFDGWFCWGC
ncbi:hypothetical protein MHU86_22466 [Fragilaria crotonensis]|nr:hypothetical protein MHU86_22466 [Fragilaria crotonensis]